MNFLTRDMYAQKHGVSREAVRQWINGRHIKPYILSSPTGDKYIIAEDEPCPISVYNTPVGYTSVANWCKLNGRSCCAVFNLIFTRQIKDIYRIPKTRRFLVPLNFKYPKIRTGRKPAILKSGYQTLGKWCRDNKRSVQKTLKANYFNPLPGCVLDNGRLYVPVGWEWPSDYNEKGK